MHLLCVLEKSVCTTNTKSLLVSEDVGVMWLEHHLMSELGLVFGSGQVALCLFILHSVK